MTLRLGEQSPTFLGGGGDHCHGKILKIQTGCTCPEELSPSRSRGGSVRSTCAISRRPSTVAFKMLMFCGQGSRLTNTLMWIDVLFAEPENCGQRENE